MKNIDLETFYGRAKTSLKIASSYIGNKRLAQMITSCRLKPITVFDNTFKDGRLEIWWVDEFGNSMLLKSNECVVVLNDSDIKANTQISTDLFGGRYILDVAKISKCVALASESLLFYGNDEYFRCFNKHSGKKISPLEVDPKLISEILEHVGHKYKDGKPDYIIYGLPNTEVETILKKEYGKYE